MLLNFNSQQLQELNYNFKPRLFFLFFTYTKDLMESKKADSNRLFFFYLEFD